MIPYRNINSMQFGKHNNYKEFIYSKPSVFILGVLVILLCMSVFERLTVERDMSNRRTVSEKELLRLQERKIELKERVKHLEGERGIEEEIRKNFDVAQEGEKVIILVGDKEKKDSPITKNITKSAWYKFWQ